MCGFLFWSFLECLAWRRGGRAQADAGCFGIREHLLHQLLAALLGERKNRQADLPPLFRERQADVRVMIAFSIGHRVFLSRLDRDGLASGTVTLAARATGTCEPK